MLKQNRLLVLSLFMIPFSAFAARDLGAAADAAVSQAATIAKALSVLGILCGAAISQIPGATMFARGVIVSGLVGAAISFGGPSLIALFRSVFGG